jgi:hypothetical protein
MDRKGKEKISGDAQTHKEEGDLIRFLIEIMGEHKVRQADRQQGDHISLHSFF